MQAAANELRAGLTSMTGLTPLVEADSAARSIVIELAEAESKTKAHVGEPSPIGEAGAFAVMRRNERSLAIVAGTEQGLVHAVAGLLEHLGARFPVGAPAQFPHIEVARLRAIEPFSVKPSFTRRAFVSDIMT